MQHISEMLETYPFLSFIKYSHTEYIGVIQNHDVDVVSIYVFNKLKSDEEKREFLRLADVWWWESNRKIPLNIFLKGEWKKFQHTLVTLSAKDIKDLRGHCVSLHSLADRRTKRRVLQLVRKMN